VSLQFPPQYAGVYFFADLCGGYIRVLDPDTKDVDDFATGISQPVDLKVSDDGDLYYLARGGSGVLYRISANTASGANLRVASLKVPKRAASGATISVKDGTSNGGTGSAAASETGFWLSADNTLGGDAFLGSRSVPALPAGVSHQDTTAISLPTLTPGTYFVIAEADSDDDVTESNEGDNTAARKILVGPDLVGLLATLPASPNSTAPTTIRVTTKNTGAELAAASVSRLYRSVDGSIGAGDTLIREFAIPPLAAQSSHLSEVTLVLPAGTYFLIARVDAGGIVAEVSDSNNIKKAKKIVP
jgi:hypothetical protein